MIAEELKMWFEFGKSQGKELKEEAKKVGWRKALKKKRGQVTMAWVGLIAGLILTLYVVVLIIAKFRPPIVDQIQQTNDTVTQDILTDLDSNTKSSLSMTSMIPFIAAIAGILGLLFGIFRG